MTQHDPANPRQAAVSALNPQTRRPLSDCFSGQSSHDYEVKHGDDQGNQDSDFLCCAAGHARATTHQTGDHSTEDHNQREQDIVDQQGPAAQRKGCAKA